MTEFSDVPHWFKEWHYDHATVGSIVMSWRIYQKGYRAGRKAEGKARSITGLMKTIKRMEKK